MKFDFRKYWDTFVHWKGWKATASFFEKAWYSTISWTLWKKLFCLPFLLVLLLSVLCAALFLTQPAYAQTTYVITDGSRVLEGGGREGTAAVASTSLRLSAEVASRVFDPMSCPSFPTNRAIHSFTPMDATSTPKVTTVNSTGSGETIFPTELFASSTPMNKISTATQSPDRYSARAWP